MNGLMILYLTVKSILNRLKIKPSKIFLITYFATLTFIMSIPLLQRGFVCGDDWEYHLARIQNISDCLFFRIFPAKIHITSLNGYGYGSGLFYPNLFLYFPAMLRFLGLGLSASYKIFLIIVIFLTIISSYFSTKYIFKSRYASIIASTLFVTSQTFITNAYLRCAVGETLAAIFLPIVIAALYNIIYEKFSKPWILIFGFLGLIYCHTISLFLAGLIFTFILTVNCKTVLFSQNLPKYYGLKVLIKLFMAAIIVLLLSISYWLPMLEQFCFAKFNVNNEGIRIGDCSLKLSELFCSARPGLGLPLLLISMIFILVSTNRKFKLSRHFIIIGLILAFLSTNLFKWKLFNNTIINKIQFPWRLCPLAALFLSIGVGGGINFTFRKIKERKMVLIFLFVLTGIFSVNILTSISNNSIYLPKDICNHGFAIGGGAEWLPLNTDISELNSPDKVYTSNGRSINLTKRIGNTIYFEYDESLYGKSDYFDVPLLFYKGYSATISEFDGNIKTLDVVCSPNNNICRVINSENLEGEICVKYSGTKLQHISYLINFFAIVIFVIFFKTRAYFFSVALKLSRLCS